MGLSPTQVVSLATLSLREVQGTQPHGQIAVPAFHWFVARATPGRTFWFMGGIN